MNFKSQLLILLSIIILIGCSKSKKKTETKDSTETPETLENGRSSKFYSGLSESCT